MIWTKGAHQTAKFQTFDCSRKIPPNLYFDRLFLLKVYKISQQENYGGVMSRDTEEWYKIWRKTDLLFQKWQEFGEFWSEHSNVSKFFTLIGPFSAKYITSGLKKWWGFIFHDNEEPCKIWRKTDFWFGKWHEEFGKCSPMSKWSVKIGTLMGYFCPKWKMHGLKI